MTAAQTKQKPAFEAPFDQLQELGEQMIETTRKNSHRALDSYEKAVDRAVDVELKLAEASKQDFVKSVIESHAEWTRELTSAYTSAARQLIG